MEPSFEELRGKITDPVSGISITLPDDWSALKMPSSSGNIFLIESDAKLGGMTFAVGQIIEYGEQANFELPPELTVETGEDGLFSYQVLHMQGGKRNWAKIWKRLTGTYEIMIMYQWDKSYEYELETVNKIIATLYIPKVLEN
jgi:hypothetical protein